MYYDVIIKSKSSFLNSRFTYKSDDTIEIGSRVIVPFGKADTLTLAFVMGEKKEVDEDINIKEIEEVIDLKPILNREMIELVYYMVDNNLSDYSSAIQTMMPPGGIDNVVENFENGPKYLEMDEEEQEFFIQPRTFDDIFTKFKSKYTKSDIKSLVRDQKLLSAYDKNLKASKKYIYYISIDESTPNKALAKNATSQIAIINYLKEHKEVEQKELIESTSTNVQTLKALFEKKYVKIRREDFYRNVLKEGLSEDEKPKLNLEQQNVIDTILNNEKNHFLLHGITGSGKTEVYLRLVEHFINEGKEAIILVPEISLTPQTIERFQRRFGQDIAVLHSKLNISERYDQWNLIKKKKVKIVVGARSAIFAPFENLGIIVIDEEHENSYKSDKNPKYDVREIAKIRSNISNAKLVLGTATPSVETMYEVYLRNIELLRLNHRATDAKLPTIDIVDMREELKANNFTMFSRTLQDKITKALDKKHQVILFLNKRGHTSYVFCRSCGYVHRCEACDVAMTYHKHNDRLVCHFCGRTNQRRNTCISCGSTYIKEFGAGTERLEEETKAMFPDERIFRMDADTISNKHDYDRVYNLMVNNEIDILIGTQMLAKGLDFPNVTVVGAIAADISLNLPDFKSSEKTYQLLTQVAGRAGRGDYEGSVVIQTYNPNHFAIEATQNNDYYGFFKQEIYNRKKFMYPPFLNILIINFSSKSRDLSVANAVKCISQIRSFVRAENMELRELSGPTPSVIERINNRYRFNVIVKAIEKEDVLKVARYIKDNIDKDNRVYVNYSINPDSVY